MDTPRIRQATTADLPALARLTSQLGYPTTEVSLRPRLTRILASSGDCLWVAEVPADGVVGWIHGFLCQLLESDFRAEIGGLIVEKRWQRQGLGRLLVNALEHWASEPGATELSVRCRAARRDAHQFYAAMAFRHSKTQYVFRREIRRPT